MARTLGFMKRSGDFDVDKFHHVTVKLVLADENTNEFETAIVLCRDIRM